ncbi:MAG: hypothetical protein GY839_18835 [candidate division Zixibacteria bacterium]|nr:hypothetical protein [candidate division Zixibacteria bacterium]
MQGSLKSRVRKAGQSFTQYASARNYIDAMKHWLSGLDKGESFNALPSPDKVGAPVNSHEIYVMANSQLESEARLKGDIFVSKADFAIEARRRLESEAENVESQ